MSCGINAAATALLSVVLSLEGAAGSAISPISVGGGDSMVSISTGSGVAVLISMGEGGGEGRVSAATLTSMGAMDCARGAGGFRKLIPCCRGMFCSLRVRANLFWSSTHRRVAGFTYGLGVLAVGMGLARGGVNDGRMGWRGGGGGGVGPVEGVASPPRTISISFRPSTLNPPPPTPLCCI